MLPVEFARISGRQPDSSECLSLVRLGAMRVQTPGALADSEHLEEALANLAEREGVATGCIGYVAPTHEPP